MNLVARARRNLWHLRHGGLRGLTEHRRRAKAESFGPQRAVKARGAGRSSRPAAEVSFDEWPLPAAPVRRAELRVATILDDFSRLALSYEWTNVAVRPESWRETLEAEPVDLLFVESAWNGNEGAWRYALTGADGPRQNIRDLVAWCRDRGIPTVFWNKEDPSHHEDFLDAARLFDWVFTTDEDMLPRYRVALGHERVGAMSFAAQPAIHNPIRPVAGWQDRDVAFAGMYFAHRHPERRGQMHLLLDAALAVSPRMDRGLEIFSRQLGGDDKYQFPSPYSDRVVGYLTYAQMLAAYRAYKVFLNVNTVVGSKSMCARRIFEITASGTPVVSTESPAISTCFASDEVAQVASGVEAQYALRTLVRSPELRDRMVHRAQRKIWREHTYAHRVDRVLEAAGLEAHTATRAVPSVTGLVSTIRPQQLDHLLDTFGAQEGVELQLAILAHGWHLDEAELRARAAARGLENVVVLHAGRDVPLGTCLNRLVDAAGGDFVAKIDDDDLYGRHYLRDSIDALGFSGADVVGKQAHFIRLVGPDILALRFAEREHRFTDFVMGPTLVMPRDVAHHHPFEPRGLGEDTAFLRSVAASGGRIYSASRFGFAQVRGGANHTWAASDNELLASAQVQVVGFSEGHIDA